MPQVTAPLIVTIGPGGFMLRLKGERGAYPASCLKLLKVCGRREQYRRGEWQGE